MDRAKRFICSRRHRLNRYARETRRVHIFVGVPSFDGTLFVVSRPSDQLYRLEPASSTPSRGSVGSAAHVHLKLLSTELDAAVAPRSPVRDALAVALSLRRMRGNWTGLYGLLSDMIAHETLKERPLDMGRHSDLTSHLNPYWVTLAFIASGLIWWAVIAIC